MDRKWTHNATKEKNISGQSTCEKETKSVCGGGGQEGDDLT